jgi:hypothetical protein
MTEKSDRDRLNHAIRELCRQRNYYFRPWETKPWDAWGPCPYPANSAGGATWAAAQRLRRQLIAEIMGQAEERG